MKRFIALWARLTDTERRTASHEVIARMDAYPEARDSILDFLAREHRTTRDAVARWTVERRADRLARAPCIEPQLLGHLVATWLITQRTPLLVRFLDVAGISNLNGVVDVRTALVEAPTAALAQAVRTIRAEFPAREVNFYLDALEAQGPLGMKALPQARLEASSPARTRTDGAAATGVAAPTIHAGAGHADSHRPAPLMDALAKDGLVSLGTTFASPQHVRIANGPPPPDIVAQLPSHDPLFSDPEALTPLDDLLCRAATASAAGSHGALSLDRLRDVFEEVQRLNAERHRSYYHLGFLDVVQGNAVDPLFPQASERHRGWYLSGAVHALSRRGDTAAIASLLDRHPADLRRLLGDRHEACGMTVLVLFDALCAVGRRTDALRGLTPASVGRAAEPLMERLLHEASGLLGAGQAAEALSVLMLLSDGIEARTRRGLAVEGGLVARAALKRALALRMHGSFDSAQEAFESLSRSADPAVAGAAQAGLGLALCRVRSISEVRLPRRSTDLEATVHALEPGEAAFREAADRSGPGRVVADVSLGTLLLARGRGEAARPHLERAVAATQAVGALEEGYGVSARLRLCLGLVLAETLEPGHAGEAVEHLVAGVRGVPEEAHAYVLARALAALAATKPDLAASATQTLHTLLGDRLLDSALEAGLLPAHEALREALARRAEAASRPRRSRGTDAEALLRDALAAGDVGRAEQALATLEDLSDDAEGRARLLGLLADRSRYDPAWRAEEALDARVRLLEADGRYREAAVLLCAAGHEALSHAGERGLPLVADLLGRIEGYGIECPDPGLVARHAALRAPGRAPATTLAHEPVGRIYVIGGNEVQAQYEEWLRAEALRRWPRVELELDFAGWAKNWGRVLPAIEGHIRGAQAVVVMRFIRTLLGRAVRSLCGTHERPWIACTGHGRQSLLLAIEEAVGQLKDSSPAA